ncbi:MULTISPECIES: SDR family oxidoreductase [Streptomycetaceae]|uniref:Short chain dehydrogenase n=1 Tax=Streptantibioticus cattleyicolor (strain ATCC 35852 / DSM 46488 / JCM 4925 / NBRC 14057 / NRRL 8057) TaxID=1003195 RepID=F8JTJ8_STREN|nr:MULTISPECIES: SDR family oxidoreductase [Streptomycetaceae]AEW95564.1 short chain dehydrogenase [Streptantibioticus cattleyicolor NRRL 8057 = DSM 46488]MYS60115.1 SDR family oxidoreductase [Streptomyces sp. SID5468]CCB75901.1 putative oxidoreductase ephD [Streptantibioticus cattleyicolor NRRL 8057 = DSM 46488]
MTGHDNGTEASTTAPATGRHRVVRSGTVDLSVTEYGDPARPTVVLVHGYPDCKEVWQPVADRLAGRFHVVLYDVRGHGASSAPEPLRGGFRLEKLTDDFLAVADAVSPDRPVHLVGHDWGSVQGWEFATVRRTEGRIASFTSVSGPSLDHFGHWIKERVARPTPRRTAQLLGQGARSWYVYALHTPVLPELAWRGVLGRRWPAMLARVERLPEDAGYPTASLRQDAAHGAWLYRDNVRERLRRPRPDAYAHVPVQLITPSGDLFLSERLYDDLERWAPGLRRRTLSAKHWVPRTRPDQLAAWIAEFADAHEGTSTGAATETAPAGSGAGRTGRPGARSRTSAAERLTARAAERFAGQLVLVTGAGSGIGRATAYAFAEAGARIVAVDRDPEGAARTAELSRLLGAPEAWAEVTDVSDERAMEKLADRVTDSHGVVDVLVNNAGIGLAGSFLDTTADDWRKVLDVNLWGVLHGCRLFGQRMTERGQGGHIVNTASAAAYLPSRTLPAYSTSKAAVLMLSECLRAELAPHGIGVTAVCPGLVDTNITATTRFTGVSDQEQERMRAKSSRLYRIRAYPPEKVAAALLRGVLDNTAVVPVTPEARGARLLSRLSPAAIRALARLDPPL